MRQDQTLPPVKVQACLGMLENGREGPRRVHLHGDFNFSQRELLYLFGCWRRCLFYSQGLGLYLRHVERKAEGKSRLRCFRERFCEMQGTSRTVWGSRNTVRHGAGMRGPLPFLFQDQHGSDPEAHKGCASFVTWCILHIWKPGDNAGVGMAFGNGISQKVPAVGQHLCSCGVRGKDTRLPTWVCGTLSGSLRDTWLGSGDFQQVGTKGEPNVNYCY